MIDFQSSLVAALCRRQSSPEGCWKLAGDNIPGKPSRYPRALKGRRKEPMFIRSALYAFVACWLKSALAPQFPQTWPSLPKAAQPCPSASPGEGYGFPVSLQTMSGYVSLCQVEKLKKVPCPAFLSSRLCCLRLLLFKTTQINPHMPNTNQIPAHTGQKMSLPSFKLF